MARRGGGGVDGRAVGRAVGRIGGKDAKVSVLLRPDDAHRLKLFAMAQGVDLGDVVTAGILPLLAGFTVSYRTASSGSTSSAVSAGPETDAQDLRVAG